MIDQDKIKRIKWPTAPAKVRLELARLGITQREAAEMLRVDPRTVRSYVSHASDVSPIPFASFAILKLTEVAK